MTKYSWWNQSGSSSHFTQQVDREENNVAPDDVRYQQDTQKRRRRQQQEQQPCYKKSRKRCILFLALVSLASCGNIFYMSAKIPNKSLYYNNQSVVVTPSKKQFINSSSAAKNFFNFNPKWCGSSWTALTKEKSHILRKNKSLVAWTISGGSEYRSFLKTLLNQWESLLSPISVIVIALDQETATLACHQLGYFAIYWDTPVASYSRVADAKFQVSAYWAMHGIDQFFVELDVFCRKSPLPLFQQPQYHLPSSSSPQQQPGTAFPRANEDGTAATSTSLPDLVLIGHGDVQVNVNIGMYYVKASPRVAQFFQTLTHILQRSLTQPTYMRGLLLQNTYNNMNEKTFFDQQVFQDCLLAPNPPVIYLGLNDTNHTHELLLQACSDQTGQGQQQQQRYNISWAFISNTYISSFRPPTVFDSTYCIHPLANQPFSSFRSKLAAAKFLGFDPETSAMEEEEDDDDPRPLLKTLTGDLVFSESWESGFAEAQWTNPTIQRYKLQYPIAFLVALAWKTQRVLVLPRHIRSRVTTAYPVMGLVSTASIEQWVPWRFLTPLEVRVLEMKKKNATRVVQMPTEIGVLNEQQLLDAVAFQCQSLQVCAIQGLHRLRPMVPNNNNNNLLEHIIQNLTWCLNPPPRYNGKFYFTMGAGHYEYPCE